MRGIMSGIYQQLLPPISCLQWMGRTPLFVVAVVSAVVCLAWIEMTVTWTVMNDGRTVGGIICVCNICVKRKQLYIFATLLDQSDREFTGNWLPL